MASNDQDLNYKLRMSAAFQKMGYTVFQEVDLSTFSYQPKYQRKQVSDFDVLGLLIEPDFGMTTAVAECKSIDFKAMEMLLKLKGLKEFFHADKAYLVQKCIDVNAREVARDMGIWCMDDSNLVSLLRGLDVKDEDDVAIERYVYLEKERISKELKNAHQKCLEYLRYDFWTLPCHRNIINLIRHASLLSGKVAADKKNDVVLCHMLVTNLGVAISRLTLDVMRFDNNDVETGIHNRIHGGTRERRDREALFDAFAKIAPHAGLSVLPPFFSGLCEVVSRFINASSSASQVVRCLNHFTRQEILAGHAHKICDAEHSFSERTIKLARDVLYFVSRECHLPAEMFKTALNL